MIFLIPGIILSCTLIEWQSDGHGRKGLGRKIYEKTIEIAKELDVITCCEVNTIPRNEPSLAFHENFGLKVGTRITMITVLYTYPGLLNWKPHL